MQQDVINVERGIKNKPWARQRYWKRETPPSYNEIVHLAQSFETEMESALFSICYLTGGRISEIVPRKFLLKRTYKKVKLPGEKKHKYVVVKTVKKEHNYVGIRRRDIQEQFIDGIRVMVFSLENRKNRAELRKLCPVPIERERELVNIIYNYTNKFQYEESLFPFSMRKAEMIINRVGLNAHFLRDIRATHLAQNYDFTEYHLIAFMGWTDGRPAKHYVQRNWKKMVKNYGR